MKKNGLILVLGCLLAACGTEQQVIDNKKSDSQQDALMNLVDKQKNNVELASTQPTKPPFFNDATAPLAQTGFLGNPNVQQFMHYQSNHGLDTNYLTQFFAQVHYRSNLIGVMNRPATSLPWYHFQQGNSGAAKTKGGQRFYQQHRAVIDRAARDYGVPAALIVAIIGIETNYGANMGKVRVGDSLATLAFDYPRRGAFFQGELVEFLKLAREEGRDPMSFTGSFAGAMGMPQFMPSSFRKWAVDYDGDGRRNIWSSVPDVAASVANYMKVHGWQTGGKMIIPVSLNITPQLQAIIDEKTALNYTVAQFKQMGVLPLQAVSDHEKAVLYRLEVSPNRYEYFLGLNNFYAVWKYNNSRMYVTAVRDIANAVGAAGL